MAFPLPPTDNLYKFIAITGVLIILGTQFIFWTWEWASWQKRFEVEPGVAVLAREMSRLKEESHEIEKEIDNAKRLKDPTKLERLREREKRYLERFDAHWAKTNELDAKGKLLVLMDKRTNRLHILAIIGGSIGGGFMAVGFLLWYTRVQVYQDFALRENSQPRSGS